MTLLSWERVFVYSEDSRGRTGCQTGADKENVRECHAGGGGWQEKRGISEGFLGEVTRMGEGVCFFVRQGLDLAENHGIIKDGK